MKRRAPGGRATGGQVGRSGNPPSGEEGFAFPGSSGRAPVLFVGSFPDPNVRLEPPLPEIALLGRSNVGKSSLLNALVGRRNLARVSATPGKTRLVNVFRLPACYLVDLPGYGYAKASKPERARFQALLRGYLSSARPLAGIVWLLDARHLPSKDDLEFREILAQSGVPVLATLTKSDKLGRMALAAQQRAIAAAIGFAADELLVTSSVDGTGIADLAQSIEAVARDAQSTGDVP